jgi:hypothetical protein
VKWEELEAYKPHDLAESWLKAGRMRPPCHRETAFFCGARDHRIKLHFIVCFDTSSLFKSAYQFKCSDEA